ncbi:unnamed protein product [Parajaminaea phylloscopi]
MNTRGKCGKEAGFDFNCVLEQTHVGQIGARRCAGSWRRENDACLLPSGTKRSNNGLRSPSARPVVAATTSTPATTVMTIPQHFPLAANLPVYCLGWIANDAFVYAGGGGKSRTGVGNLVRVIHLPTSATSANDASLAAELKLSSDEDAPMAMAVDAHDSQTIILGINEADEQKSVGNNHLRIIAFKGDGKSISLAPLKSAPAVPLTDPADAYLKRLLLAPESRQILAASTEGAYSLQEYPSLVAAFQPTSDFEGEEIVDADFSADGTQLVVCTGRKLKVLGTYPNPVDPSAGTGSAQSAEGASDAAISRTEAALRANAEAGVGPVSSLSDILDTKAARDNARHLGSPPVWQTIQNPALGGEGGCEFRAVRFGKARASQGSVARQANANKSPEAGKAAQDTQNSDEPQAGAPSQNADGSAPAKSNTQSNGRPQGGSEGKLFTVVNAKASGKTRGAKRKSFLTAWSLSTWELIETRQLAEKPVTVFDISPCGRYLAYGSSDLSIGVINARTLRPVFRILDAHSFPPTALSFSPDGRWLVSASADNTLRVVKMPASAADDVELGSSGSVGLAMVSLVEHKWLLTLILTLFILVLALYIQRNLLPSM